VIVCGSNHDHPNKWQKGGREKRAFWKNGKVLAGNINKIFIKRL